MEMMWPPSIIEDQYLLLYRLCIIYINANLLLQIDIKNTLRVDMRTNFERKRGLTETLSASFCVVVGPVLTSGLTWTPHDICADF